MNVAVNDLAISVFKKPLAECSVADLKQLASQFPWFGPAQILYAKKLQAGSPTLYEDQVQKTILYFENRLWLHHLLNENEPTEIIAAPPAEEKNLTEYTAKTEYIHTEIITEEIMAEPSEDAGRTIETEKDLSPAIMHESTEIPAPVQYPREEKTEESNEGPVTEETLQQEISSPLTEASVAADQYESTEIVVPVQYPEEEKIADSNESPATEAPLQEEISSHVEQVTAAMEEVEETGSEIEVPDAIAEVETKTESLPDLPPLRFQPINTMNAPLTFEPYHTIDYFASQGIKIIEDEKPKQRFDQQLKSFTEWLKAMKRVTAAEIAAAPDSGGEKKVVQMAEHSLVERHIVTEAMAEVWVKQGNIAKAEEIYRKLSLLDPPKTAYFAAKIEDLKKTS
jgi:hypothetical protein